VNTRSIEDAMSIFTKVIKAPINFNLILRFNFFCSLTIYELSFCSFQLY
jgi:hypothetical protein